jgi:hypothetical protein
MTEWGWRRARLSSRVGERLEDTVMPAQAGIQYTQAPAIAS